VTGLGALPLSYVPVMLGGLSKRRANGRERDQADWIAGSVRP
jgi:hypothetical protein